MFLSSVCEHKRHKRKNITKISIKEKGEARNCHRYDFWYVFIGTDSTFSNFLNFYSSLGIDHDPHVFYVHMTYVYSLFLMFHLSHDHMAKRSHCRIMIFSTLEYKLFYRRTLTLILFYFLHNPTTPILPVYVDQRRPHLEKDTTRPRGVISRQISAVPRRTRVTPD